MRIGVLLAGCGMYDGSDVHETTLLLLALEEVGERPVLIAPEVDQDRTVDHLSGDEVVDERREVLRESARLGRTALRTLENYRPEDLEALVIPGGYGPVVNLSSGFARSGEPRRILPAVKRFIEHFIDERKPIGLISLGEVPVRTILQQELEIAPPPHDPDRPTIDAQRAIVHTPGFSVFTRMQDVQRGIRAMVAELLRLMGERQRQSAGDVTATTPEER